MNILLQTILHRFLGFNTWYGFFALLVIGTLITMGIVELLGWG